MGFFCQRRRLASKFVWSIKCPGPNYGVRIKDIEVYCTLLSLCRNSNMVLTVVMRHRAIGQNQSTFREGRRAGQIALYNRLLCVV